MRKKSRREIEAAVEQLADDPRGGVPGSIFGFETPDGDVVTPGQSDPIFVMPWSLQRKWAGTEPGDSVEWLPPWTPINATSSSSPDGPPAGDR